ncbi:crotonobetainyl-CoA hydratase [Zobellella endophytica]|uniref:Crotonobetainyl-CoA hydratase n=1 Tax=Zobellella endophytica TaxID=2116700 RepID=A0A2P7QQX8_9GAMM|nr:crotonobetainyl-CoA hydratase [Zobellella endophytica]
MSSAVITERRGRVLIIRLNRPKANAIDTGTSRALYQAFMELEQDDGLSVGIITAGGERFFSAGWDLKAGEAVDADHGPGGFAGLTELFGLRKPVIAAVNGLAVGGGFELVLAADLILAVPHAEFFLPEARIGITPDSGGVFRLPRRLPRALAMDMLFTGKRLSAEQALLYGLINAVVAPEELLPRAISLAEDIAESAPLALQAIKELVAETEHLSLPQAFVAQRAGDMPCYRRMLKSQDAEEGVRAFGEGRQPCWQGK